jgi:hypothetical protein
MKSIFAKFKLCLLSISMVWGVCAQAQEPVQEPVQGSEVSVSLGKYSLTDVNPIELNGSRYLRVQLMANDPVVLQDRAMPNAKNWIVFSSDLLQATGAVYGVMRVNPRQDKLRHFFAGYAAASLTHGTLELILPNNLKHRRLISALAGVAKEYWDSLGHGHVETLDAAATAGGGVVGSASGGFGSAIVNSALGGLLSSLTLTIDTDKVIKRVKKRAGLSHDPDYKPF